MKKRIVAILLTLTLVFSLCTTFAYAKGIDPELWTKVSTGIGKVAGAMEDALARQPEATGKIQKAFKRVVIAMMLQPKAVGEIVEVGDKSDVGEIVGGLAATGAGMMDAIARQPEAEGKVKMAFNYVALACVLMPSASAGLGKAGSSMMDAIARQPEAYDNKQYFEKYNLKTAWACVAVANALMPWANVGLGKAGGDMMDAIARQPEAANKIINNYCISAVATGLSTISRGATVLAFLPWDDIINYFTPSDSELQPQA